jgi:hypothetical protein
VELAGAGIGVKVAGTGVDSARVGRTGMDVSVSATIVPSVSGVGAGVPVTPHARTVKSKIRTGRNFGEMDLFIGTSIFPIVNDMD